MQALGPNLAWGEVEDGQWTLKRCIDPQLIAAGKLVHDLQPISF